MSKATPLMQQYRKLKQAYKDSVLLFQMGDFYECFFEDAKILAKELGITLTSREKGEGAPAMAGFPIKALDTYLPKLVKKGYKVAIAQQVEDPRLAKGIVERRVVEVVTPATLTTGQDFSEDQDFYAMSVFEDQGRLYVAVGSLLTGNVWVDSLQTFNEVFLLIKKYSVKEIVVLDNQTNVINKLRDKAFIVPLRGNLLSVKDFKKELKDRFDKKSFGFGIRSSKEALALLMLIYHFEDTKQQEIRHLRVLRLPKTNVMDIDPTTLRNLDIFENNLTKDKEHSLWGVLAQASTPLGHRLLRRWLLYPSTDIREINKRYNHVESLLSKWPGIQELLKNVYDTERLTGLLALRRITPKQVSMLRNSLEYSQQALTSLQDITNKDFNASIQKIQKVLDLINKYLVENPSNVPGEGEIIKSQISAELKKLRDLAFNSTKVLNELLEQEKQKTKIEKLKLGFNKVFGYYFEVPKGQLSKVPEYFVRKQTLVNAERFFTPKLKEIEEQVLSAQEQLRVLEATLYQDFVTKLSQYIKVLQEISQIIAYWDLITNFAKIADLYGYTRPELLGSSKDKVLLDLKDARHPVVERFTENFVPNSIQVKKDKPFIILTGPNMGGKSTFIRQVALITLMAQIGSFVPAQKAKIVVRDKIFARVGASDDITTGRSTFMVELSEVSYILNNATSKSLLILDEIGRGTSTHEGYALAYAISLYIQQKIKALTFFATHFHELTVLEDTHKGFVNYKVDVLEEGDNVYFLHTISRGKADKSYGIYVAQLASLPKEIIEQAKVVLNRLSEKTGLYANKTPLQMDLLSVAKTLKNSKHTSNAQTPEDKNLKKIVQELKDLDINQLTPLEALTILAELKEKAK